MSDPVILLPEAGYRREFRVEGKTVLSVSATYAPLAAGGCPKRVERYQQACIRQWISHWAGPILERAAAARPEVPWRAQLTLQELYRGAGMLSLCREVTQWTGGSKPAQVRQYDTWHLPSGYPVELREVLPRQRWWKGPVFAAIRQQIGGRVSSGEAVYYEDWPHLVAHRFDPERWYLSETGPVVVYPPEVLAPAMEGWLEFPVGEKASGSAPDGESPKQGRKGKGKHSRTKMERTGP